MVELHGPEAGGLQTTAMDIVEPERPATGSIITVFFILFFHRRAAPARFAAIPTWRRRWVVGALGARPDAYTLRRIEAALVMHNGFCHAHTRQWYGRGRREYI